LVSRQPGVYSEVTAKIFGKPGDPVNLTLNGPAVTPPATQDVKEGPDGTVNVVWKITRYGTYTVRGEYNKGTESKWFEVKDNIVVK